MSQNDILLRNNKCGVKDKRTKAVEKHIILYLAENNCAIDNKQYKIFTKLVENFILSRTV